ncbi:MAG: hypothetical protein ACRDZ4_05140 [Egibacteraceae bacterium]
MSRLVMVDVTWAQWRFTPWERPQEQVWAKYRKLLRGLLALDEGACKPGAWILRVKEGQRSGDWRSRAEAEQVVERIAKGLRHCGKKSTSAWMTHQEKQLAAQMNRFACRIYLDPARATKLARQTDPCPPDAHVCIDFRFEEHPEEHPDEHLGLYWLYVTLSVWTRKPTSLAHAPDLPVPVRCPCKARELDGWYAKTLCAKLKERVGEQFPLKQTKILRREHRPPRFWYAEVPGLRMTPRSVDKIKSARLDKLNELAGVLLDAPDVRSTEMAAGVIDNRMLVLRRFIRDDRGDFPCYLLIPLDGAAEERENKAWELVRELTDLEAFAAARLFDVVTSLEMCASHLRVYEAVVHQAEEFWNQLALYLPVTRGSRVHKLVELVHQTLLQGIADLDQVAIEANKAGQKTERSANELKDKFDQEFTERILPPLPGAQTIRASLTEIRASLTETGYFDKAARQAGLVHKDAEQTQRSYETLLEGIARAFDEQRVRGADVIQRVAFGFAILAGLFAFLPEAVNALLTNLAGNGQSPAYGYLAPGTIVGTVAFLLVGTGLVLRGRWLRRLGSRRFRRRHKRIRAFLADCATERLTRLRDDGWKQVRIVLDDPSKDERCEWDSIFVKWDKCDRVLSCKCAKILGKLALDTSRKHIGIGRRAEVKQLGRRVERWALKALLVSERPRQFWQFALPRLAFLYRFYPMMRGELRSSFIQEGEADVVSDADLSLTLEHQCGGDLEQIDLLMRWAQRQVGQPGSPSQLSATDFVEALDEVGLRAGMTGKDFRAMLERLDEQLPAAA